MTLEDAKKAIDSFREEGHTEEDIARTFYLMFVDGVLDLEDFETLIGLVGYELTEEFRNMSPEEQKTKPFEDMEQPQSQPKEVEKEKEEPQPQPKEKESEQSQSQSQSQSQPSEEKKEESQPKEEEDPQPQDEEKALKLFGLKK